MVKQKSKYSCESAIYFDLEPDIIKENCNFTYFFNKTDITPTALDGGNEIILVNCRDDKHVICNVNDVIPVKIPQSSICISKQRCIMQLWDRSRKYFSLESLAACHNAKSKLVMYFMVNMAFVNYLTVLTI